jgi:hypothetical protein
MFRSGAAVLIRGKHLQRSKVITRALAPNLGRVAIVSNKVRLGVEVRGRDARGAQNIETPPHYLVHPTPNNPRTRPGKSPGAPSSAQLFSHRRK